MNKIIETLRRRVSASSLRVVSAPYLPSSLIAAALILVYTDWMVILIGQSGAYWIDASRATSSLPAIQGCIISRHSSIPSGGSCLPAPGLAPVIHSDPIAGFTALDGVQP